jgi:hypothetical protein
MTDGDADQCALQTRPSTQKLASDLLRHAKQIK